MSQKSDEAEMSSIETLRKCKSIRDLAAILNVKPRSLSYIIYHSPIKKRYNEFTIAKKGGGVRVIEAPRPELKNIQTLLNDFLKKCLQEIESKHKTRTRMSHAYSKDRSIFTNAKNHIRSKNVLNIDIANYFHSINFGRVRGYFISSKEFGLDDNTATIIAQICCHNNRLPQGAPTSPLVSNLISHNLDIKLSGIAKKSGCYYTRYADDITFSSKKIKFPRSIARQSLLRKSHWILSKDIKGAFRNAGFSINKKKVSMQSSGSRQIVTGLIVNKKVNIKKEYYKSTRSMCHALFSSGEYYIENKKYNDVNPLVGRLSHINFVKFNHKTTEKGKSEKPKNESLTGHSKIYRDLLYFSYFVNSKSTIIVTEGKTDIIYLKSAKDQFRSKGYHVAFEFLSPSRTNLNLLNLGHGTGGMIKVINTYDKILSNFKFCPLPNPVIFLVDADEGGKPVINNASSQSIGSLSWDSPVNHLHVRNNLYVVKTPVIGGKMSSMEDLFDAATLSRIVDGKEFCRADNFDSAKYYGKSVFADRVVKANKSSIDFNGFDPVFAAIRECQLDYYRRNPGVRRSATTP